MKIKLAKNKDRKALARDLDECWSLYIKLRDGLRCRFESIAMSSGKCGKQFQLSMNSKCEWKIPQGLQAAHIIRRQNHRYRWDIKNGIALCTGHHLLFDGLWRDTGKSDELLVQLKILTSEELELMKFTARQPAKVDVKLQMMGMIQAWEELMVKDEHCLMIYRQLTEKRILSL